jgi:acyl-CoA thioester hydrolase
MKRRKVMTARFIPPGAQRAKPGGAASRTFPRLHRAVTDYKFVLSRRAATNLCGSPPSCNAPPVTIVARIKIELPDRFSFSTAIMVYTNHINYGNHLDNSALLSLVSEARVRFFKALGYTELDVEGYGIIVADAAIHYRSEAFHGEVLDFEMTANDFNKYGCDLVYRVSEQSSGREVARGKTGIMFFDYAARKPASVPAVFRERFAA